MIVRVRSLTEYTPEVAKAMRGLLVELSRSGTDRGEIPEEWFRDVISSPYHDVLLAWDEEQHTVVGMATMSITMGPGIRKNAYLEDFVVSSAVREGGIGSALWTAMEMWAKGKGCARMEFTCGNGREVAQQFYKNHGAEIYDTNFFRKELK